MSHSRSHVVRSLTWLAAVCALAGAPASASASTSSGDPTGNRSLAPATWSSCRANPTGSSCINSALADINAGHAAEGVLAMVLPSGFGSMTVPVQLLNLANLERVDRGLSPILGLSTALSQDAQAGAAQDRDPMPTNFYGNQATSNWAAGYGSALEADFAWMYDDGMGSANLDCTSSDHTGCWGHRHDILWPFSAPIAMGAGYASGQDGPSMTELFVGGDRRAGPGQPDAPGVQPAAVTIGGGATISSAGGGSRRHLRAQVGPVVPAGTSVNVTLACTGSGNALCKLRLLLTISAPRKDASAAMTVAIAAGRSRSVNVALSAAARRLLFSRHRLRTVLVVKTAGKTGRGALLVSRVVVFTARG